MQIIFIGDSIVQYSTEETVPVATQLNRLCGTSIRDVGTTGITQDMSDRIQAYINRNTGADLFASIAMNPVAMDENNPKEPPDYLEHNKDLFSTTAPRERKAKLSPAERLRLKQIEKRKSK